MRATRAGRAIARCTAVVLVGAACVVPAVAASATGHARTSDAEVILRSSSARPATHLGEAIAISGNTMVVGAPATVTGAGGGQGAVYVYTRSRSGAWSTRPVAVLTVKGSPATPFGEGLGSAVAISGATIVAGDPSARDTAGAVYVFARSSHGWRTTNHPAATLTARAGETLSWLGATLTMHGGTIVAGAGVVQSSSSEYPAAVVFVRKGSRWASEHDTADLVYQSSAYLESSFAVAMTADTIVMGCDLFSKAWVFTRPSGGWASTTTPTMQLSESNAASGPGDALGASVAIEGSTVMVGAPGWGFSPEPTYKGAVYQYAEPTGGWATASSPLSDSAAVGAPTERLGDGFGASLALSGQLLSVGAPDRSIGHRYSAGEGFVFMKPATGWSHAVNLATMADPNGGADDEMGLGTAIDGASVAFGADGAYKYVGAVDVYTAKTHAKLTGFAGSATGRA
jgi:FG-GAP repeat